MSLGNLHTILHCGHGLLALDCFHPAAKLHDRRRPTCLLGWPPQTDRAFCNPLSGLQSTSALVLTSTRILFCGQCHVLSCSGPRDVRLADFRAAAWCKTHSARSLSAAVRRFDCATPTLDFLQSTALACHRCAVHCTASICCQHPAIWVAAHAHAHAH
jgi:hypothetical protein